MDSGRSSRGGLGIGAATVAQVALLAWIAGLGASGVAAAVAIGAIGAATLVPAALRRAPDAVVTATAAAVAGHARKRLDLVGSRQPSPRGLVYASVR